MCHVFVADDDDDDDDEDDEDGGDDGDAEDVSNRPSNYLSIDLSKTSKLEKHLTEQKKSRRAKNTIVALICWDSWPPVSQTKIRKSIEDLHISYVNEGVPEALASNMSYDRKTIL